MSEVDQLVTVTIDSYQVSVPKGTMVIRAAEQLGIAIPRFCDHPLLDPVGACRQCLVEIATPDREGNLRPMPKRFLMKLNSINPPLSSHGRKFRIPRHTMPFQVTMSCSVKAQSIFI